MSKQPIAPGEIQNAHTQSELAKFFGVQRETIQNWTRKGLPVASKENGAVWYDSKLAVAWHIKQSAPSADDDSTEELRRRKLDAETQIEELKLLVERNEVADLEVVAKEFTDSFLSFRARMLQMPSVLTPMIIGETDETTMKQEIKKLVYEALEELSQCRWCEASD